MKYQKELYEQLKTWPESGNESSNNTALMCVKSFSEGGNEYTSGSVYTGTKHYSIDCFEHICTREEYFSHGGNIITTEVVDKGAKYLKTFVDRNTGESVKGDIYTVLEAFEVTCPAMQHAIKKLLMPGQRGSKGYDKDCDEAINSIEQSKLLQKFR